ncbi:YicC family protein [candidate division KSB3 bacterium]|uniref:YicC family protein n=1 Tax=candidate division KSB3 bacterium TaxID=2044937 RepID=A0A9D5JVQ8_9BACT|nr:YicC family protein [candidate division KSB3 bacterium]MBD3325030.1 YicC family protein [candidate division KSB3 bacterium]
MMKSMTGYGTAKGQTDAGRSYTIELKSVNHRYCDAHVKLPGKLSFLEHEIKKMIQNRFQRGRFDLYLSLDEVGNESKQITFDRDLAAQYLEKFRELGSFLALDVQIDLFALTRMPDVIKIEQAELDQDTVKTEVVSLLHDAFEQLDQMRIHEGSLLERDILSHLDHMRTNIATIVTHAETTPTQYKAALEDRISRLTENVVEIDQERLSQELILFADRIDISEELTRLTGHMDHFVHLLNTQDQDQAVGRKLDFLIQEMNREVNTIGSKANNADISQQVVDIKATLEKIREQVQNIE